MVKTMATHKWHAQAGFSLVELLIVMLILAVVMTAAMSLMIPAKRASVVQGSLADVQGNLRVAMERLTKDFRNAGFMYQTDPDTGDTAVSGYVNDLTTPSEIVQVDASVQPIIINTRAVSGRFGRVEQITTLDSTRVNVDLLYGMQAGYFRAGDYVAIAEPVNGTILGSGIYQVDSTGAGKIVIPESDITVFDSSDAGLLVYLAPSTNTADLDRTITYRHEDTDGDGNADTLTRQIDGGGHQMLARNISSAIFTLEEDDDGDVAKVTIALGGETVAASQEIVGRAKTKTMTAVASLRNF